MEEAMMMNRGGDEHMGLPPGFRFHPTDEEIITHYLTKKVINCSFVAAAIGDVDLNKCEPWDLPKMAKMGEKEWYFFSQKDRKYPTGMRTNRATDSGYWKATGKDKEIYRGKNCLVGMKKTLVFYRGRAPKGEKTNWVMHEYRLEGTIPFYSIHKVAKDEWVVCRIFHKSTGIKKPTLIPGMPTMNSGGDEEVSAGSLPPLVDPSYSGGPSSSFTDGENEFKGGTGMGMNNNSSVLRTSGGNFLYNNVLPNHQALHGSMSNINNPGHSSFQMNGNYFYPNVQSHTNMFQVQGLPNQAYQPSQLGTMNPPCKVEPYQSRSMVSGPSQDTGLSTDLTPEISSGISKQVLARSTTTFEELVGPLIDPIDSDNILEFPWDYTD